MARKTSKKTTTDAATPAPVETKEQKLQRLAEQRVPRACKYILLIGNLAAYKPTDADTDAIMAALGDACATVDNRLRAVKKSVTPFTLRVHPG